MGREERNGEREGGRLPAPLRRLLLLLLLLLPTPRRTAAGTRTRDRDASSFLKKKRRLQQRKAHEVLFFRGAAPVGSEEWRGHAAVSARCTPACSGAGREKRSLIGGLAYAPGGRMGAGGKGMETERERERRPREVLRCAHAWD